MNLNSSGARFNEVAQYLSPRLSLAVGLIKDIYKSQIEEIRLRVNKNLSVTLPGGSKFVNLNGDLIENVDNSLLVSSDDINESLGYICNMSIYAHQNQIKKGYITVKGGHRAGICGTAVLENEIIQNIRDITSINLRVAREIIGCSEEIYKSLFVNSIDGCLIISPPCGGKTTILRDLARTISNNGKKVAIVDERGEIGASYQGIIQNDIGQLSDLLDGYPKNLGIIYAIRSLNPDVIICDEVGDENDVLAIAEGLKTGVPIIMSAHSKCIEDLKNRIAIMHIINIGAIKNIVLLNGADQPGRIKKIVRVGEINWLK